MRTLYHYIIYFKMQVTVRDLWFDVTLKVTLGRHHLCWKHLFLPWIRYDSW